MAVELVNDGPSRSCSAEQGSATRRAPGGAILSAPHFTASRNGREAPIFVEKTASDRRFGDQENSLADMLATERTLSRDIVPPVEHAVPGVEVLAVELLSPSRFCVYVDHTKGVDHALCARVTELLADYRASYTIDVFFTGLDRPLRTPAHFRAAIGQDVQIRNGRRHRWQEALSRHRGCRLRTERPPRLRRHGARHPVRADRPGQPDRRGIGEVMSQEIMEGIRTIEREKGIESGTLVAALEDALLAAYKKTPGASRHAEVILDDEGEFRVFSIEIPPTSRSGSSRRRVRPRSTSSSASKRRPASASTRSSTTPISSSTGRRCRRSDGARRRDAGRLRPDRRDDGQAGHPAAHP